MKTILSIAAVVAVLASPITSFAATNDNGPVTRAEVHTQLVQLEQAGYTVGGGEDLNYPVGIQAAEARVEGGQPAKAAATHPVAHFWKTASTDFSALRHNTPASSCVGPADFCTPYFGG